MVRDLGTINMSLCRGSQPVGSGSLSMLQRQRLPRCLPRAALVTCSWGGQRPCLPAQAAPSLPADDFKSTAASPGLEVRGLTIKGQNWVQQNLWDVCEPPPGN